MIVAYSRDKIFGQGVKMEIAAINNSNYNPNFNARLCGDYETVLKLSKEAKLSCIAKNILVKQIHKLVPGNKDKVFFTLRRINPSGEFSSVQDEVIISEVALLRKNSDKPILYTVNPCNVTQHNLFQAMVEGLKSIVTGKDPAMSGYRYHYADYGSWLRKAAKKLEYGEPQYK